MYQVVYSLLGCNIAPVLQVGLINILISLLSVASCSKVSSSGSSTSQINKKAESPILSKRRLITDYIMQILNDLLGNQYSCLPKLCEVSQQLSAFQAAYFMQLVRPINVAVLSSGTIPMNLAASDRYYLADCASTACRPILVPIRVAAGGLSKHVNFDN